MIKWWWLHGVTYIDDSKFPARNLKNNNSAKNKFDDRIKWLNGHIDVYLMSFEDDIVSHMITDNGKDGYKIEIDYQEAEADATSIDPEGLT